MSRTERGVNPEREFQNEPHGEFTQSGDLRIYRVLGEGTYVRRLQGFIVAKCDYANVPTVNIDATELEAVIGAISGEPLYPKMPTGALVIDTIEAGMPTARLVIATNGERAFVHEFFPGEVELLQPAKERLLSSFPASVPCELTLHAGWGYA